ncbi:YihY/virulence factor BrkB family protein [Nocardioides ferulae]|uniref:YihY/virulence factor BrkB family protein n=1 Tax=Nocardioides ferulae TaxID=2340821 RepID=UPI000EB4934E|nr:YihY/virulence factor BrkB family protein [Nocardioides ferulae]
MRSLRARLERLRSRVPEPVACLVREIRRDRALGLASEIAFFTVLSVFPGLLVVAGLASYLDALVGADLADRIRERVISSLELVLTQRAGGVVESVEAVLAGEYGGLLTFATLGALLTISGAWSVVIDALNQAYGVSERRTWLRRRLLGLGLGLATVVVVVLTLAVVVVGPLLGRGEQVADTVGLGDAFTTGWWLLRLPVLFALVTLWLVVVFRQAPNRRGAWRAELPGAVTTSTLWLLASAGFALYLRLVGDRNPVLGAFGGGIIVLMWVYLLSIALLVGGELNAVLHERRAAARGGGGGGRHRS